MPTSLARNIYKIRQIKIKPLSASSIIKILQNLQEKISQFLKKESHLFHFLEKAHQHTFVSLLYIYYNFPNYRVMIALNCTNSPAFQDLHPPTPTAIKALIIFIETQARSHMEQTATDFSLSPKKRDSIKAKR